MTARRKARNNRGAAERESYEGDMSRARWAFVGFVVALPALFEVARADPCQTILEEFRTLSDRANREVESTVANCAKPSPTSGTARRGLY
jgi:hypothetical protein